MKVSFSEFSLASFASTQCPKSYFSQFSIFFPFSFQERLCRLHPCPSRLLSQSLVKMNIAIYLMDTRSAFCKQNVSFIPYFSFIVFGFVMFYTWHKLLKKNSLGYCLGGFFFFIFTTVASAQASAPSPVQAKPGSLVETDHLPPFLLH